MASKKDIKKQIKQFLKDPSKKRIEITAPKGFRTRKVVNPAKLCYRKLILTAQKMMTPSRFKNWLLNTAGLNIGYDVCVPHYIHFDPYFPELITVEKGSLIGGVSAFYTHEIKDNKLNLGRIHVKEKVLLAGMSTIRPGVTINKYVITGIGCNITKDCPEKTFVVGNDKVVKQWNDEEVKRYFGDSKHDHNYYKDFKKITRDFRKNKEIMVVKINNNGKRLNPGNEWYLARPWPRIFYNAFFVELARILPFNWLRKFLWRCMGTKIGKNVYIGKGTVFDHIYGDKVVIGNNVHIGDYGYIDGHSYTIAESVFGRVHIGDNTKTGKNVFFMCGVKVGKNCTILDNSGVMKDVPDGETWGGIPAKPVEQKK